MKICEIQGGGASTMAPTTTVTTEGVVVAAFLDTAPFGFFLQEPECDGDALTSDGLFVYVPKGVEAQVAPGQRVRVAGRAKEYQGLTELLVSDGGVTSLGAAELPAPAELHRPPTWRPRRRCSRPTRGCASSCAASRRSAARTRTARCP
ncbi:MAG: hypothetical protein U0470_05920 [Anaerolineae bacterium]